MKAYKGRLFRRCGCRDEAGKQYRWAWKSDVDPTGICPRMVDDKHGTWGYRISAGTDPGTGKRRVIVKSVGTRAEASRALSKLETSLNEGQYRSDARQTVGAYLPTWLGRLERKGRAASTLHMYRRYVEMDIVPALGKVRLSELTKSQVRRFLDGLDEAGRGEVTIERILATLRSAMSSAVDDELITSNPAAIKFERTRKDPREVWTPVQFGEFLDSVVDEDRLGLYEFVGFAGLRRGEALGLRWEDVDLDAGLITVRQARVVVSGKVQKSRTKTESSRRRVGVTGRALAALKAQQKRQAAHRAEWGRAYVESGFVFTAENGEALNPELVTKRFRREVERSGLPKMTFHDLRHLAASLLIASGTDVSLVSKYLGHSSVSMTSDVYAHMYESVSRDMSARAEALVPVPKLRVIEGGGGNTVGTQRAVND